MALDLKGLLPILMNLDQYLYRIVNENSFLAYITVFFIVFSEAGLIIFTFLPGDSLIFVTGALASVKLLSLPLVFTLLLAAVIAGDMINYSIGKFLGKKIMKKKNTRFFKKEYMEKAHNFYERHGRVAIIMGRFLPVIRSFVSFAAGVGTMSFRKLVLYSSIGGLLRISLYLMGGYYFGSLQIVRRNLVIAIMIVTMVTMLPVVFGFIKQKIIKKK